jgi:excisionase family DNA binding protein
VITPESSPEPLQVDIKTAAQLIGVSRSFLYELMGSAKFPVKPVRLGSKILFNRRQLVAWIEGGCQSAERWRGSK